MKKTVILVCSVLTVLVYVLSSCSGGGGGSGSSGGGTVPQGTIDQKLIGRWWDHPLAGLYTYEIVFNSDGTYTETGSANGTISGKYAANGTTITLRPDHREAKVSDMPYSLYKTTADNDTLALPNEAYYAGYSTQATIVLYRKN